MNWPERLQRIDNRWLYLALVIVVSVPIFWPIPLPIPITRETRGLFASVQNTPPGKLVMLHMTWDASTIGECEGQCHALVEHLMRQHIPFVVWASNPASPPFYQRVITAAAKKYGRVYGRDWVDFGYKVPDDQKRFGIQSMARDFPGYMKTDFYGTPVSAIPVLQNARDATAFNLMVSIGYNPTIEFIQFVEPVYGTKVGFGAAAMHSTVLFTYIDSKQIVGMLVGARGGAEYETLLNTPGKGVEILKAQTYAHVLIIGLVLVGNLAMLATRKTRREPPE
jgi:hypothetical protein